MPTSQEQIDAKTKELDTLLAEADSRVRTFVEETGRAISAQALPIAKTIGKGQPAISARLGGERLGKLIDEVRMYADSALNTAEKCIYTKTAWYALSWKDKERYQHHPRGNSYINGCPPEARKVGPHLIDALRPLGALLERYGFSTQGQHRRDDLHHEAVWQAFTWTPEMTSVLTKYAEVERKISDVQRAIDELTKDKLKGEADTLWDSLS